MFTICFIPLIDYCTFPLKPCSPGVGTVPVPIVPPPVPPAPTVTGYDSPSTRGNFASVDVEPPDSSEAYEFL